MTIFLAIVFCAAMALMLLSAVAFIQDNRFFSSAPKEAREVIKQKDKELFYGARKYPSNLNYSRAYSPYPAIKEETGK